MKKFYLLLTVGLLILSAILITKYTRPTEKQFSSNEFTPEEFWQKQFQEKKAKRKLGYSKADKPDMFSKYYKDITTRIGESESGYKMNYKTLELKKSRENSPKLKSTKATLEFIQRGPANVGGRTRAIVVDPDDTNKNTWYAGSASGGIWKTTDGAETWTDLSNDLTNLSVNALFMAPSDHDIIYAGTGESFPGSANNLGNGIWKSVDRGVSWSQMKSIATDENFSYVNRLWVNPINADIVIAATEHGIFKTTDGGIAWAQVYKSDPEYNGVEVLAAHPDEENTIYAGENSKGVLRSQDGGNTWELKSDGLVAGGRYELAVSPVNKDIVYASVNVSGEESYVCVSKDNATSWLCYKDEDADPKNENYLGGQGDYDNAITAHPFNENEVFVAGVNMWKISLNDLATEKGGVEKAYAQNADFLSFVDFGGSHLSGGLSTQEGINLEDSDWTSIEIRFGTGLSQKAHRFTVPNQATSGVSPSAYTYKNYVDVPFQVWDTKNNRQLMVSFRDQENDGVFNLYPRKGNDDYGNFGREYIYVNAVEYNADAEDEDIAVSGGHIHKALYMIWPQLSANAEWNSDNLPFSKIVVKYGIIKSYGGTTTSVADAYGNFGGGNNYDQGGSYGKTKITGLHADHHNITIIPMEDGNFRVVNGNDGGIGVSEDNGITFTQKPNNYITTQFYGVAKNPEANEYIGGMQDNGTWQSVANEVASSKSNYLFSLPGDGFECLWHSTDPKKLLGSVYNNTIYKTTDGGHNWRGVNGITKDDGPFVTRLSTSKSHPDVVFAVGNTGVYKSTDFGSNWKLKTIGANWSNGTVYSVHNVEVSLADPNIVWAGAAMMNNSSYKMHVSKDEGETYSTVSQYTEQDMNAYISGIATHPTEPNTAYLLFSTSHAPKILRTTDLGENWEDISGFGTGDKSTRGFPDVVTHCLLVLPHDTKTLWAGTEIGLFESTDNGLNWHAREGNLPPVSIYDMHLVGDQVVIATHGRGIWSVDIPVISSTPVISEFKEIKDHVIKLDVDVKDDYDYMEIYINNELNKTVQTPSKGLTSFELELKEDGEYNAFVMAYIGQDQMKSNTLNVEIISTGIEAIQEDLGEMKIYPNPCRGAFKLQLGHSTQDFTLEIFDLTGKKVYSQRDKNAGDNTIRIESLKNGLYIVRVELDGKVMSSKIQILK